MSLDKLVNCCLLPHFLFDNTNRLHDAERMYVRKWKLLTEIKPCSTSMRNYGHVRRCANHVQLREALLRVYTYNHQRGNAIVIF